MFAVRPGAKEPAIRGWQKAATLNPEGVARLWASTPHANIGVLQGSGLYVVDADTHEAAAELSGLGVLDGVPTVDTPRGGHFYFREPGGSPTHKLGGGVEIRGDGSYVLGGGSRRPQGQYVVRVPLWEVEPGPMPPELRSYLADLARSGADVAHQVGEATQYKIREGSRHATLITIGGRLRLAGLAADEIGIALRTMDANRCMPPMADDPDGAEELSRIIDYVTGRPEVAPWFADPLGYVFGRFPALTPTDRAVLEQLARHADFGGRCWPSMARIAAGAHISRRSVVDAIARLEAAEVISVDRPAKSSRNRRANAYRLRP